MSTVAAPRPAGGGRLRSMDFSILQQCMHCGMCLPTCPTFAETHIERHSPRGRIALMRAIAGGERDLTRAFGEEMYSCLGCLACVSACPAGVDYARLFEAARADVESARLLASPRRDAIRWFALRVLFRRPRLLRTLGRLLWLYQAAGLERAQRALRLNTWLPRRLRELEAQMPRLERRYSDALIARSETSRGPRRHRVVMLTGCVQDLLFPQINRATVDVLLENGCDVDTPRSQPCCGSLHAHNGDLNSARDLARRHLDAVDPFAVDAILSNAGGCGSHLRDYGHLLADDPVYAARAAEWARKLRDIHEWLVAIGFRRPHAVPASLHSGGPVTYHDSCHLCHGQGVSRQPRAILEAIPGVELRECAEATVCCGSAGIYTLTHPEMAAVLQAHKVAHLAETGAAVVTTANPGCHLQIENGLRAIPAGAPSLTRSCSWPRPTRRSAAPDTDLSGRL